MTDDTPPKTNRTSDPAEPASDVPRLLPTAQAEFQFGYDRGLMCWNTTSMIEILQLVMPDEATARAVHALIEHEHPAINAVAARRSGSHGDRWVVQLPVGQALRFGLLPKGVAYENFETLLPKARITGDPADGEARAAALEHAQQSWGQRMLATFRNRGRTKD